MIDDEERLRHPAIASNKIRNSKASRNIVIFSQAGLYAKRFDRATTGGTWAKAGKGTRQKLGESDRYAD